MAWVFKGKREIRKERGVAYTFYREDDTVVFCFCVGATWGGLPLLVLCAPREQVGREEWERIKHSYERWAERWIIALPIFERRYLSVLRYGVFTALNLAEDMLEGEEVGHLAEGEGPLSLPALTMCHEDKGYACVCCIFDRESRPAGLCMCSPLVEVGCEEWDRDPHRSVPPGEKMVFRLFFRSKDEIAALREDFRKVFSRAENWLFGAPAPMYV